MQKYILNMERYSDAALNGDRLGDLYGANSASMKIEKLHSGKI
jgi:hypothetical protein